MARAAPLGAGGMLLVWALFFGEATDDTRLFWIAVAAVLSAGLLGSAALAGLVPLPRPGRAGVAFLVSLLGLVLWTGASLGWSIVPDHSWDYLNRGLAYLAFAVVGTFVGALVPRAPRVVAFGLLALGTGVVVWALATKAIPSLGPSGNVERLQSPVGFWNALALIAAATLPLALWLTRLRRPIEAALLFYATSVVLLLTLSRAGTLIAVVVVLVWLALVRPRLEALVALVVATPAAVVVAVLGAAGAASLDGGWFALVLLAGAGAVGGAAAFARERAEPKWERPIVGTIAVALAGAAIGLGLSAGGPSGWWHEFTSPEQLGQSSGRFRSTSSSNRWTWWNEAWDIFEQHPGLGTGADSFEVARRPIRQNAINVTEPHSTPLQFLSELGVIGFLLLAATTVAGVAAVRSGLRRLEPEDRPPALALALLPLAYGLHALVDFDWDFVAVTGPALFVVGVFAGLGGAVVRRRSVVAAAAVLALSLTALYSLSAPWLADRRVYASGVVLEDDAVAAAHKARSAHRLNPLSPEPLWAWGLADWLAGDQDAALRRFEAAAELQPENWETWYRLGTFEFTLGRYADACYALDLAYRHDPRGPAGEPGAELDQVKKRLPGCPASTAARR